MTRRSTIQTLSKTLIKASASASIVALVAGTPAVAQEGEKENALEEIIITATKRAESIQTVGLSVTALQGEDLQARGVSEFTDYAISIPNLSFGATDDGVLANRTISIRGIEGLNTTSFYIDDIPLDESIDPLVLDVERVEVLRGPQGTLFGARGLGGTIRVITKKPEFDEATIRFHGGLSNTKEGGLNYLFDAAANIPISDRFAARATAYYQYEEGIFDKIVGPSTAPGVVVPAGTAGALVGDAPSTQEDIDDREIYGGQLALRLDASDALTFNGRVMHQRTELSGFPLADFVTNQTTGELTLVGDDFTQERLFNVDEGGTDEWVQVSLNINYETDFGTFTSATGYFDRTTNEFEDSSEFISFTLLGPILQGAGLPTQPTAVSSPIFQSLEFKTFAEEIRFVSDFAGDFQMTVGAFYQNTDDNEAFDPPNIAPGFDAVFSGFLGAPGGLTGTGDLIFTSDTHMQIEELGLFGEFTYNFTDKLSATLGVRYFDTEVTTDDVIGGFAAGGLNIVSPETVQSEDGFNFKGLIEYEANENVFVYASVAEGFRIGGTNGELPATLGCPAQAEALGFGSGDDTRTFGSDSLVSYELGTKTTWNGGKLTVNAAAFHVNFDNIQQRILLGCGFDFVGNIGAAKSTGFEFEIAGRPNEHWFLQAAAGYTNARFTETVPGIATDGDPLQQVPEWTFSATVDYETPASFGDFQWFSRSDFAYVDSSISTVVDSNSPRIRPSYAQVNTRFGLRNDQYAITLFVDNLFNEDAVYSDNRTLAAEAGGRPRIVRNRPRTIGIDFRANF